MSLEEELQNVLVANPSVKEVKILSGDLKEVKIVIQDQGIFWGEWPHGDDPGTKEQQEEYIQNYFDIDWELVEITARRPQEFVMTR